MVILSRGTSRDGTGQSQKIPARPVPWQDFELVPLSLCPGTKKVLPVPLSLCPGTRAGANVPGQTPLSRDIPGQNEFLKILKKGLISCFRTTFLLF